MYKYLSSSRSYLRQGTLRYLHAASSSKSSILTEAACWRFQLCWRRVLVCSFSVLLWVRIWSAVVCGEVASWSVRSEVFLFRIELSCLNDLQRHRVSLRFWRLPSTATTSFFVCDFFEAKSLNVNCLFDFSSKKIQARRQQATPLAQAPFRKMSAYTEQVLVDKLSRLSNSQQSIQSRNSLLLCNFASKKSNTQRFLTGSCTTGSGWALV